MSLLQIALLVALAIAAEAKGAGVWKDPEHYVSESSLAGLRFVSESAHVLTMVGTDDGFKFWMLKGNCSGPGMNDITFDFSPKGGPAKLTGKWSTDGSILSITWPDGNAWTSVAPNAALSATVTDTYWGLFLDDAHVVPGSYAGVRVIAEQPQHTLHMVGSDDGKTWWYLQGICHDVNDNLKPMFKFDFSPKGGPKDLVAWWDHHTIIKFPDGNEWKKPPFVNMLQADPGAARTSIFLPAMLVSLAAIGALLWATRSQRSTGREQL